jgi:hypothetical protein
MSDSWIYRDFGQDFGPVPFAQLQNLAASGTIPRDCKVRSSTGTTWKQAADIEGLTFPRATSVSGSAGSDPNLNTKGADDWFYNVGGLELGPVSFDELLDLGRNEQIAADDPVKLGINGKWRRAGSIGRLMAVLPFQVAQKKTQRTSAASIAIAPNVASLPVAPQPNIIAPTSTPNINAPIEPSAQTGYHEAYERAKENIAGLIVAQAEAAYKAAEAQANQEIAWAFAPNVDNQWWGWMGGAEYGPVEFQQVLALARNGQIKPPDFIRNGMLGQYIPVGSLPGLFNAVAILAKANESLALANAQANAAVALVAPVPTKPAVIEKAKRPTPSTNIPVVQATEATPQRPIKPATQTPATEIAQRDITKDVKPAANSNPMVSVVTQPSRPVDRNAEVLDQVKEALASRSIPGLNRIELELSNGELVMRGNLASEGERLLALRVAGQVPGVTNVVDALTVAQSGRMMAAKSAPTIMAAKPAQRSGPGAISRLIESVNGLNLKYGVSAVAVMGLLGFGLWSFAGSSRPVSVHPVKGRLMMNGEPLADAAIVLHRIGHSKIPANLHPRARAKEDGTFALETFDPADGAPNGEFVATVCLNKAVVTDGETLPGPNVLPAVYSRPETSPLKIKITASTRELQPLELVVEK